MAAPVEMVAILSPQEGKIDRVIEILEGVAKYMLASEPGAVKYEIVREINKESGAPQLFVFESYKDMEAVQEHSKSKPFQDFIASSQSEGLLLGPPDIKFIKHSGGFSSR